MVVEQVVVHDLEAVGCDMLVRSVDFNYSITLACLSFFLIYPAIKVLVVQQEDNELLVKLNHLFPGRASDMDVFQRCQTDVAVVIFEQEFELDLASTLCFEEV